MSEDGGPSRHDRWARLRFAIVGSLLAAPPRRGHLMAALRALAAQTWRHPITEQPVGFGFSTIERWYYVARQAARDPVGVLRRQRRRDAGQHWALSAKLRDVLHAQYRAHPSWTYQLHTDNLAVLVAADASLGGMPSYNTVRRFMVTQGLVPQPAPAPPATPGAARALRRRCHGRWGRSRSGRWGK